MEHNTLPHHFRALIRAILTRPKQSRIHQLMVKIHVKTVNIGKGHREHQDIMCSWTRFKALICAVLTSPESHKMVQNS